MRRRCGRRCTGSGSSPRARRAHRKAKLRLWEKYGLTPAPQICDGAGPPPPSSELGPGPLASAGHMPEWEWAQVGMGASGSGCKWEWVQVGVGGSGNHAEAQVLCAVDGGARRPRAGDGGAAADVLSGDRPHSSAGGVLRGRTTRTRTHAHVHTHTHAHAGTEAVSTAREALVAPPQIPRHEVCLPTSAPGQGSPLPHLHQERAHSCHICAGSGLAPATSSPGVGPPLPASTPELGLSPAHPHLRRDSGPTTR